MRVCVFAFITYSFKHTALCIIALLRWEKLKFSWDWNVLLIVKDTSWCFWKGPHNAICGLLYLSLPLLCIAFHRIYCSVFLSEWIQKHERDKCSGGGRLVDCALLVPLWLFSNSPLSPSHPLLQPKKSLPFNPTFTRKHLITGGHFCHNL